MNERVRQVMADTVAALCDRIEAGSVGDWRMPWHHVGAHIMAPRSVNGHRYQAGNRIALAMAAMTSGYSAGTWATYKQWREVGGQVQKGQHGTPIVVFSQRERNPEPDEAPSDDTVDVVRFYKTITVFNVDQQQGWSPTAAEGPDESQRIAAAETWTATVVRGGAVDVRHGGNRAYFSPTSDHVQLPTFQQFDTPVAYYSTLWHELTHWTGPRVDRAVKFTRWGDDAYAAEELVAELGAAFCCADRGLRATPRVDHAQYLAHWLRVLRADPARLWTAGKLAETAVEHLAACADRVAAATGPHRHTHHPPPTGPTAGALSITARLDQLEHRRRTPDRGLTR
jgi:antirestriction protein ArdC